MVAADIAHLTAALEGSGAEGFVAVVTPAVMIAAGLRDALPCAIVARCTRECPAYPPGVFASIRSDEEAARLRASLGGRAAGR